MAGNSAGEPVIITRRRTNGSCEAAQSTRRRLNSGLNRAISGTGGGQKRGVRGLEARAGMPRARA